MLRNTETHRELRNAEMQKLVCVSAFLSPPHPFLLGRGVAAPGRRRRARAAQAREAGARGRGGAPPEKRRGPWRPRGAPLAAIAPTEEITTCATQPGPAPGRRRRGRAARAREAGARGRRGRTAGRMLGAHRRIEKWLNGSRKSCSRPPRGGPPGKRHGPRRLRGAPRGPPHVVYGVTGCKV